MLLFIREFRENRCR